MTIRCRERKAYRQGRIVLDAEPKQSYDPRNHDQRKQKSADEIRRIIAARLQSN
jgi:hypothetical protein